MAFKYSNEVLINGSIDEVVRIFYDMDNVKEWMPGLQKTELIEGQKGQPGAVTKMKFKIGKRDVEMTEKIIFVNLPEEMMSTYETKNAKSSLFSRFEKVDDYKTRYRTDSEFNLKGFMKIMGWLSPKSFENQSQEIMESFKLYAESKIGQKAKQESLAENI